jgi:hypothetical protein
MFPLVSDQVRLDVHNNAPDRLSRLNCQVQVDLIQNNNHTIYILIEDVQRLLRIDGSGVDRTRIRKINQLANHNYIINLLLP